MMFVNSLSLFVILRASSCILVSASLSLRDLNNLVWVKTCVGLEYRRGIPSPITVAKKVVNSIRSAVAAKGVETLRDINDNLKQGKPEFYYESGRSQTDQHKKCHGLLLDTPLPDSIYQKLVKSVKPDYLQDPTLPEEPSSEEVVPEHPLVVNADADGKYIHTVTNYVRDFLKDM